MNEAWHAPDFTAPDFTQPALQQTDFTTPGFTLPDPAQPSMVIPSALWPADLEQGTPGQPDPASPDLTMPDVPGDLDLPASNTHVLPAPNYEPEVVMGQRPGTLDPAALEMLHDSPDDTELPPDLSYPQLYITQNEMSRRRRHLGMLELGLERVERAES